MPFTPSVQRAGYDKGHAAGRILGREEGRREGWERGRLEGRKEGRELGRREGMQAGLQEGQRDGRHAGALALVCRQLKHRIGPLSRETQARVWALPPARVEALADALLEFQSSQDLDVWLQGHTEDSLRA